MADEMNELEEVYVVTATDDNGNEVEYQEVQRIDMDGKTFSLLVELCEEEGCDCEGDAIIARIDTENGEDIYVAPTNEEFEAANQKFDELLAACAAEE